MFICVHLWIVFDMSEASNTEYVTITVDGRELQAPKGAMLIEVSNKADICHAFEHGKSLVESASNRAA